MQLVDWGVFNPWPWLIAFVYSGVASYGWSRAKAQETTESCAVNSPGPLLPRLLHCPHPTWCRDCWWLCFQFSDYELPCQASQNSLNPWIWTHNWMDASWAVLGSEKQTAAWECCAEGAFQPRSLRELQSASQFMGLQGEIRVVCCFVARLHHAHEYCHCRYLLDLQRLHGAGMDYKT